MNNLIPETPKKVKSALIEELCGLLVMLGLACLAPMIVFLSRPVFNDIGLTRNLLVPLYLAASVIFLACCFLAVTRYQTFIYTKNLQKQGQVHLPLKAASNKQLVAMDKWSDYLPEIRDFKQKCIAQNEMVTVNDYQQAKREVLGLLHLNESTLA